MDVRIEGKTFGKTFGTVLFVWKTDRTVPFVLPSLSSGVYCDIIFVRAMLQFAVPDVERLFRAAALLFYVLSI